MNLLTSCLSLNHVSCMHQLFLLTPNATVVSRFAGKDLADKMNVTEVTEQMLELQQHKAWFHSSTCKCFLERISIFKKYVGETNEHQCLFLNFFLLSFYTIIRDYVSGQFKVYSLCSLGNCYSQHRTCKKKLKNCSAALRAQKSQGRKGIKLL